MTGQDTTALGTSFTRSWTLYVEGYKFRHVEGKVVLVQGKPTAHTKRATGEKYINPHGPYTVNTAPSAQTCTCPAFANRGGCCHIPAATRWLEAHERGESVDIYTIERSKNYIAFQQVGGDLFHVDKLRRIVVFRDFTAAGDYWDADPELIEHTELVQLTSRNLEELAATGKYAGLALHMVEGVQALPLPEITSNRSELGSSNRRTGASKRSTDTSRELQLTGVTRPGDFD